MDDATSHSMWNNSPQHHEMSEAEYILAQEEYELQQLITSMEQEQEAASQHFGSDDEDYDSIFMECATMMNHQAQQQSQPANIGFYDADAMDVDMTDS